MANVFCIRCGARHEGSARFCLHCGAHLSTGARATDVVTRRIAVEVVGGTEGELRAQSLDDLLVGRRSPCHLIVSDRLVSPVHCRLTAVDDELWIEDLDSANGTFVNGRRITRAQIKPDDSVACGPGGPLLRGTLTVEVRVAKDDLAQTVAIDEPPAVAVGSKSVAATRRYRDPLYRDPPDSSPLRLRSWLRSLTLRPSVDGLRPVTARLVRFGLRLSPVLIAVVLLYLGSGKLVEARKRMAALVSVFKTEREMNRIVEALAMAFKVDEQLPPSLKTFLATTFEGVGKPPWQDAFGHDYILEAQTDRPLGGVVIGFVLRSTGVDGKSRTPDDIVRSYRPPNWKSIASKSQ